MILAGGGVVMGDAVEECKALAERLGAPVVNGYLRNDAFPASHPLWAGPLGYQGSKAAMKLIAQADVVIALGSRMGPFGTLPQHGMDYWPKDAKIIQVEADHTNLGLVKKISVGIYGDAKAAAKALAQRLEGRTLACDATKAARAETIAAEKAAWEKELTELDARARPVQPGHDRGGQGRGAARRALAAPAPGAARTGEGDAAARDGLDRHRQHQLGGQQLPALRGAALASSRR